MTNTKSKRTQNDLTLTQ